MARDTQRSAVYAWERAAAQQLGFNYTAEAMTLDELQEFMARVWPSERGRYGRAKVPVPSVIRVARGRRRAVARPGAHGISMPRWTRNPWQVLHELAHLLVLNTPWHGPRFVGCLIGLAARHMGLDAEELAASAEAAGVKVYRQAIGAVPAHTLPEKVARMLPGKPVEIAVRLGIEHGVQVSYRQVQGAALRLIRQGRARWAGHTIVPVAA